MDYIALIVRLKEILPGPEALAAYNFAYQGLKKEGINDLSLDQAEKRFVYYVRPLFIFHIYPSVYDTGQWLKLRVNDYCRGVEKALAKEEAVR
ncbi:hypothetical protein D931_01391 [Enterococcus faecium 13.SD.W.09]|nr:hypothetical protein D931_01391 [Enterococcus faecium 13.SD.W.09]